MKEEFVNINQLLYTNVIIAFVSLISSLVIITLYLKKKELKEDNYTIFICIAASNAINAITQFFGLVFIDYEQSTVNKKWYANTQRILNLLAEFSYAYYSLYYFYYIYEKITTFKKSSKYLYHIIIGIFLFTLSCSIIFVLFFNLNVSDDTKIVGFDGLYILNGLFSIDDVENAGIVQTLYYIVFFPPLFLCFFIINKLRIKLSESLKQDEAQKTRYLKRFYDLLMFLLVYASLNLIVGILYDTYETLFKENIINREVYYIRIDLFFSYLVNLLANSRGVVYLFIFLMDDKVAKLVSDYVEKFRTIKKIRKFLIS